MYNGSRSSSCSNDVCLFVLDEEKSNRRVAIMVSLVASFVAASIFLAFTWWTRKRKGWI